MLTNITKRIGRGFTLIELMIVVAIIGILAAIAIPNFVKFQCRSKQSEAKTNLKALYVAEEAYRGEYDLYVPITNNTASNFAGWNPRVRRFVTTTAPWARPRPSRVRASVSRTPSTATVGGSRSRTISRTLSTRALDAVTSQLMV